MKPDLTVNRMIRWPVLFALLVSFSAPLHAGASLPPSPAPACPGSGCPQADRLAATAAEWQRDGATPYQRALKEGLRERGRQGLPTPAAVQYEFRLSPQGGQRLTITGRTLVEFDNPAQAGYARWPALAVSGDLPEGAQGFARAGEYSRDIRQAVEAEIPGVWERVEFGQESRTYIISETYEITFPPAASDPAGLQTLAEFQTQTGMGIVLGNTLVGPNIRYGLFEEVKAVGVPVAKLYLGLILDWGVGLRLPLQVNLTLPSPMIQGTPYNFSSQVTPLDWSAEQFAAAGVPAEDGNEYVMRFRFFVGAQLWTIITGDIVNFRLDFNYDASGSFATPFGPGNDFPFRNWALEIPPEDTGLIWTLYEHNTLGKVTARIGLELTPGIEAASRLTADWTALDDAQGSGQIVYSDTTAETGGPLLAGDFSPEREARIRLSNFRYFFNPETAYIRADAYLSFKLFGYSSPVVPIDLGRIDLIDPGEGWDIGVHPGTASALVGSAAVEAPLEVQRSAAPGVVQPGAAVEITTRVTNRGLAELQEVGVEDALCGNQVIGNLPALQTYTYTCADHPLHDAAYPATASGRTMDGVWHSDTAQAFAYIPDGVVGSGTPAACNAGALETELTASGAPAVTFDCGAAPHMLVLEHTLRIPRSLTLDGGGRVTLSGGGLVRLLDVPKNLRVTLRALGISEGWAHRQPGAASAEGGGGIRNAGSLTLQNCTLNGNSSDYGGAIHNAAAASLRIEGSQLTGNEAADLATCPNPGDVCGGDGGAIYSEGQVIVTGSTLENNRAHGGGAILNWQAGELVLSENSVLRDNAAQNGGAIQNGAHGVVKLRDTSFSGNQARFYGGAIANYPGGQVTAVHISAVNNRVDYPENPLYLSTAGGAIANFTGAVFSLSGGSELSGNRANAGGGVHNSGVMTIAKTTLLGNTALLYGGGIYNDGSLQVLGSVIGGRDDGQANRALGGGGLLNWDDGQALISDSLVTGNQAQNGGALENGDDDSDGTLPMLQVVRSRVEYNTAFFIGGGVVNYGNGQVALRTSSVMGNTADRGAGLMNYAGGSIQALSGSGISANLARQHGGGVYNTAGVFILDGSSVTDNRAGSDMLDQESQGLGGGIYNQAGNVSVSNATVARNQAIYTGRGGGIYSAGGALALSHATIANNLSQTGSGLDGAASLRATIIAGNLSTADQLQCSGGVNASLGYNLEAGNSCGLIEPTDRVNTDPGLAPVVSCGRSSAYILPFNSPAINTIPAAACLATVDQCGFTRPQGSACDAGANERP